MPLYDYRCLKCGEKFEVQVNERPAQKGPVCPYCGSDRAERQFSPPNLLGHSRPAAGHTCCGRTERCETPPCSGGGGCRRD